MPTNNQSRITNNSPTEKRRLRVLLSAYACEPNKGSEPGVGWNVAIEMAKLHDVWVLTRANNREVIEAELARHPVPGLSFIYYDLPKWVCWRYSELLGGVFQELKMSSGCRWIN